MNLNEEIVILETYIKTHPEDDISINYYSNLTKLLEDLKYKPSLAGDYYDTRWDEICNIVRHGKP